MRVRKKFLVALLLLISARTPAAANIIYVDCIGPNDPGAGTFEDPFRRIQDGINAASAGDTVLIRPGIYTGTGNYNLDPQGKSVTIRSSDPNDPSIIAQTIIDPNQQGRGFYIHNHEDANCIVSGLTIRNAYVSSGDNGAGIYCYNCSAVISKCIIRDCVAEGGTGGGICFDYNTATITDCTITGNTAGGYGYGGGIGCRFSSPIIIGCTIRGNNAMITGGGIDCGASEPNILNCIITDNNAAGGGGINCYYPDNTNIINCTIAANTADYFGGGVYCWSEGSVTIKNSIVWANSAPDGEQLGMDFEGMATVTYCDVQGDQADVFDPCELLVWGQGNIGNDPCFALFDTNSDPNLWDFHLQSKYGRWNSTFYRIDFDNSGIINLADFAELASVWLEYGNLREDLDYSGIVGWPDIGLFAQYYLANKFEDGWITDITTSLCIDAGDPNIDWSSEPWPNGKRINIGAYGGTSQASKNGNLADFDVNGTVNLFDLLEFCSKWLDVQEGIVNLNLNGRVDFSDFAIFAQNWLWKKQ